MDLKPKGLFKRLVDFALNEVDRRSRPPQRFSSTPAAASESSHVEVPRAAPVPAEAVAQANAPADHTPVRAPAEAELPLDVTRATSGAVVVRWSLSDDDVATARAVASPEANLAVRVVSFSTDDRALVHRDVIDMPAATLAGYVTLQRPAEQRLVVSVGLLRGEHFVSIVHAQLG